MAKIPLTDLSYSHRFIKVQGQLKSFTFQLTYIILSVAEYEKTAPEL